MKAAPLLVAWHNDKAPIYSAHFETHGKGRLATAGGDNNVRLWSIEPLGSERKVTYLSTLKKHTQAVNVVRWCPRGELLASAGDDGNVLLWTPTDHPLQANNFGEDDAEDRETWMVKRMCRSTTGSEIYDLAWSPDGAFFMTGSMDNIARIFDAQTGQIVRQIAEHNHYVQGVAWDPLNEFVATQSSDRSVHIYRLKTNDGQFSLTQHGRVTRMDLPPRKISQDISRSRDSRSNDSAERPIPTSEHASIPPGSPAPSAPGTPMSLSLPMNPPPPTSQSRRSSFGAASPSIGRSASPAPSLPLPAVMPAASPSLLSLGSRNVNIYANETLTSFFRRLTFAPDGSLLFTPAGQYKTSHPSAEDAAKTADDVINTVYIYSRAGLNKPPIAHLPGHKKPSVAVKCSPVYYNLRLPSSTRNITIDTSASGESIPPLPEPAMHHQHHRATTSSSMDPPPLATVPSPAPSTRGASPRLRDGDSPAPPQIGPQPAFSLPYRVVYAVATQDAVYVYDTQQQSPICVVSNLHFATFTDLTWSADGSTLLMSSSDGFCSALSFEAGELGSIYHGSLQSRLQHPSNINTASTPSANPVTPSSVTPSGMNTMPMSMSMPKHPSSIGIAGSPSPSIHRTPASPTRSNSASSIATQSSFAAPSQSTPGMVITNPTPSMTNLPGAAIAPGSMPPTPHTMPSLVSPTPPMTPLPTGTAASVTASQPMPSPNTSFASTGASSVVLGKRESDSGAEKDDKKRRRVAPALINNNAVDSDSGSMSRRSEEVPPPSDQIPSIPAALPGLDPPDAEEQKAAGEVPQPAKEETHVAEAASLSTEMPAPEAKEKRTVW